MNGSTANGQQMQFQSIMHANFLKASLIEVLQLAWAAEQQ